MTEPTIGKRERRQEFVDRWLSYVQYLRRLKKNLDMEEGDRIDEICEVLEEIVYSAAED